MSGLILLDTHIAVWYLTEPHRLSSTVKDKMHSARDAGNLIISSITLWEVAMLVQNGV